MMQLSQRVPVIFSHFKIFRKLFVVAVFCHSMMLFSQNERLTYQNLKSPLDENIKEYTKKAYDFGMEKKFDSATFYSEKTLSLSKLIYNPNLISYAELLKARILYWQANIQSAKLIAEQNIDNEELNDSININAHLLLGEIFTYEKKLARSLRLYLNIENIISKHSYTTKRDSSQLALTYYMVGKIQLELKNIDTAKLYFKRALKLVNNSNLKSYILYRISNIYRDEENIQAALKFSLQATEIAAKNEWQLMLPTYYAVLSKNYLRLNKVDSAIYYSKKGLHNNTYCRLNWLNANIGEGYLMNKNYTKAIAYFEKALQYTSPDETLEVYEMLRQAYRESRQYKLAFQLNDSFLQLKDSLDELKIKQEIVDITEKYESDKKQLKIVSLNEKNQLNNLVINKQKAQIISSVMLLVLSIIIIGLITFFYFKQKDQKNLLYEKNRWLAQKLEDKLMLKKKIKVSSIENSQKNELLNFINMLIDDDFFLDKDMTLQKMADKGNTNTSYLSKIINEDYNKSFANFVNDLRISYILKKLEMFPEYRILTIDHIGDKAGFSSSNAFYRSFKKFTGLTPSYYIKRRLQQGDNLITS